MSSVQVGVRGPIELKEAQNSDNQRRKGESNLDWQRKKLVSSLNKIIKN